MTRRGVCASALAAVLAAAIAIPAAKAEPGDATHPEVSPDPATWEANGAKLAAGPDGAARRVTFEKMDWPNIHFSAGKAYPSADWRNVGGIVWTLHNPENEKLDVIVRVDDSPLADGVNHCRAGYATLAPGETATLVFPMGSSAPGMNAGPPLLPGVPSRNFTVYGPALSENTIVAFQIFLAKPDRARTLDLVSVRLAPKPDLNGIVDRYGQYSRADWPGKIHSDAELKQAGEDEKAWLAAHPPLADRDEYGAWKSGPTLHPSGYFRTALVGANGKEIESPLSFGEAMPAGSRWWLVAPNGHLFWSAGIDVIRPYDEGPVKGREYMFQDLPQNYRDAGQADFYLRNLQRKYGGDAKEWMAGWGGNVGPRLQSLGFNTIGNWSDVTLFRAHPVPYTVPLYVSGLPPIGPNPASGGGGFSLPDYFDERFPEMARTVFRDQTKDWKTDPWCLGYFVDNELPWDTWAQMGTGGEYLVARNALASPPTQAAHKAFAAILKKRYPTPAAWAKAWGLPAAPADWNAPVTLKVSDLNAEARVDCAAFSTALAERYFSVVRHELKEAAPHQLYLGCRFAIRPWEMVHVAAKYCDVVSFNIYEDSVAPATWAFTEKLGKPVLIGEFHFGATDRGIFHPGLRPRANQAERAAAYEAYVNSVRSLPSLVGCHWFQWTDEPLTGRFDGENYNVGFVTVADTLYPEMRDAARRVNATLYR